MRLSIASLLCLCLLTSFAYAELPTKTLAQGGWFAIGGPVFSQPNQTVSTFCNGAPCTDTNFADAFGSLLSGLLPMPGQAYYHESRTKATDALMNGEFSIDGQTCQPGADSGQAGILVSGFARYYTLRDFFYTQLQPQGVLLPRAESRVMDFTNAVGTTLINQNLGALAPASFGPLIDQTNGQPFDEANYPITFTLLDIQLHQLIANWASKLGAVVNAFKVTHLQTSSFICP